MQLRIFTFLHDKDEQTLFVDSEEMIVEMSRAVLGVPLLVKQSARVPSVTRSPVGNRDSLTGDKR